MAAGTTPGEAGIEMRPVQDVVDEARNSYREKLDKLHEIDDLDTINRGYAIHPFIVSCNAMRDTRRRYPGEFVGESQRSTEKIE